MKVLFVGHFNYPSSIGWGFVETFKKYFDVEYFDTAGPFYSYYKSIFNKIKFRAGLSSIYTDISKSLTQKVEEYKPDIIFVFKGMEIEPSTLLQFKKSGIKLINYNLDHPFIYAGIGSGNSNVRDGFKHYDLHVSYNKKLCSEIESKYNIKAYWLPFGHSFDYDYWDGIKNEEEINKMVFVGNPDEQRVKTIKLLLKNGVDIDLYGNGWEKYFEKESVKPAVYKDEFWSAIRKYRLNLNVFRTHNVNSHNMRSFDVPAVGGIMLTPYSEEQDHFFPNNISAFYYKNDAELIEKARSILKEGKTKIDSMREIAFDESKKHSYANRADEIATFILNYSW